MPSDIEIASNALLLIGDEPISSFTEPGSGAKVAANLYPTTYVAALSHHPWSFARKFQKLSKLTAKPDPLTNFSVAHQLPSDMARLWAIFPRTNYLLANDLLLSNQDDLLALYTFKVAETQLPPHFVEALEFKLAGKFAIPITEDENKAALYNRMAKDAMAMATTIDSQQAPQVPIQSSPFVDVRFSGFLNGAF